MNTTRTNKRPKRSMRKHIRLEKARLRRELPPAEAEQAIEQMVRAQRRGAVAAAPSPVAV